MSHDQQQEVLDAHQVMAFDESEIFAMADIDIAALKPILPQAQFTALAKFIMSVQEVRRIATDGGMGRTQ